MSSSDPWIRAVESEAAAFAQKYHHVYSVSAAVAAAAFEIGCFHAIVNLYSKSCRVSPENLKDGSYRYLTTPSGNPANFSFVKLEHRTTGEKFEIRQQVRVRASINREIQFTPDLIVLYTGTRIGEDLDAEYAGGKRKYFYVDSEEVIAAHECKSTNPFPELFVSFLGMLLTAHHWLKHSGLRDSIVPGGWHLAPTLFVGGSLSMWHSRMVKALTATYPINIVTGLHAGSWDLSARADMNLIRLVRQGAQSDSSRAIKSKKRLRRRFLLEDE